MAPITSYLLALIPLLSATLSSPTPSSISSAALSVRQSTTSQNFTISAVSTSTSIDGLTFGFYRFAAGYEQAYLYNHGSIPLNYASAFNFLGNGANNGILEYAANSSIQAQFSNNGAFTAAANGEAIFYAQEGTNLLAFEGQAVGGSSEVTQTSFSACPWTGDKGTGILYVIGYLVQPNAVAPQGCEVIELHADF
ncbi:MAG: hypothetical protein LQ340_002124 [Diploschistes diacapsis]|nr:MAG: hypothetical protein LQ340_002124 [Diploschistes diacapsis]